MSFFRVKGSAQVGKRFCYWLFILVLMPIWVVRAQLISPPVFQCGTENLSPTARKALEAEAALALRLKQASGFDLNNTITYVPIRPHIIRKANGTGGYSMTSLNNVLALTNKYYLQNGNGIQFYFAGTSPDYIDNDALYNQFRYITDEASFAGRDATNALNQYYVQSFNTNVGGYAYYPSNALYSTRSFILDEKNDSDMGNRLVPHELGHNFNLIHTFDSSYGYERVTRDPGAGANCTTAGDLVCDTPADPYGLAGANVTYDSNECPVYDPSSTVRDAQGQPYLPSISNIMSYYYPCTHDFTIGQYDRMQAGLAMRQSHTAYTLDAPETVMTAPSNLAASIQNYRVVVTWQDNASNEMGYFIERSTSPTTGFAPIGGVGPNVTSFTDPSALPRIRYYYRIKASNTTTGSISTTATAIAPDCRPTFSGNGCQFDIKITGVAINGKTLSENSGCSPSSGYYTSFSDVSGTVTAGQSATFTITKGTTLQMAVNIWVDLNNNGVFEASERLYQMSEMNTASTFSGSLAIPASVTASTVAMRIVAVNGVFPTDPCGAYQYGETEDYILFVIPSCNAPVAALSGTSTITTGQPATLTTNLIGSPPFSFTVNVSDGSPLIFADIATSPFNFTVAPAVSTTYTLGQVANECGTGTVSGTAEVTVNPCSVMYTLQSGDWDDPTVWSCNHVPTQTDLVQIGHTVTIPNSFVARALRIEYHAGGQLTFSTDAQLVLEP